MHARYKILIPILVLCVLLGGFALYANRMQEAGAPPTAAPLVSTGPAASSTLSAPRTVAPTALAARIAAQPQAQPVPQAQLSPSTSTVAIIAGNARYTVAISQATTVADVMQQLAKTNASFTYTTETYPGLGLFVDSINGKANSDGSYWFLYVNGQESQTGMSSTNVQPGDVIEWNYQM